MPAFTAIRGHRTRTANTSKHKVGGLRPARRSRVPSPTGSPMPKKLPATPPTKRRGGPRTAGRLQQVIDQAVTTEIERTLRVQQGNVSRSAVALGVSETALWKRIRALGISPDRHRP